MSKKPSYFKIGLFVIAGIFLIFAAVVVLGSGLLHQEKAYFETYFDESVSGLSVGSPV
jgi:phospholipid/cholesterol/gamma-HCH transport system substrate-binding protein